MSMVRMSTEFAAKLEEFLSILAKECLVNQPQDVEEYCLSFLAKKNGMQLTPVVKLARGLSVPAEEDLNDLLHDVGTATLESSEMPAFMTPVKPAYDSSQEDEGEIRNILSSHSSSSKFDIAEDLSETEMTDASMVKTARFPDVEHGHHVEEERSQPCYLFAMDGLSPAEVKKNAERYKEDKRMRSLFSAWDGDGSGAVDFVELVLALHKFQKVANAGIDIQVASDALVQFVESDTERELNMEEFSHVITVFCLNNFHKDFDEVADHLLAVATSTSEAAVLKANLGGDTRDMEAADKEEQEFLRETVKGMEEHVNDNIMKLKTKRVGFSQSRGQGQR